MGKKRVLVGYGGEWWAYCHFKSNEVLNKHQSMWMPCQAGRRSLRSFPYSFSICSQGIRINTQDGSAQNSTNVSRGIFGATVGVDRLLKLFDKHNIKATFL